MCLAIPAQILEVVDVDNRIALVDVAGVRRNANIGLLDDDGAGAGVGDWVLIHVGFALSKVDEDEAHATLALLQGMGADYEAEIEELKASRIE
jgi:hydrogenase expression/formation protein HypC